MNEDRVAREIIRNLKIKVVKMLQSKKVRVSIGKIIIEAIKEDSFGSPAESTKKWRKTYDKLNKTDPKYNRNKLNMTFTGELLDDLANNIIADTINFKYTIEHSNKKHKKYQGVTKKIGSRSSYKDISRGLIEKLGYDYLSLSESTKDKITKLIKKEFLKLL